MTGTRILLFEQIRGGGRCGHGTTAHGGESTGNAGRHDLQAHLARAVFTHPVPAHDFAGVSLADIHRQPACAPRQAVMPGELSVTPAG